MKIFLLLLIIWGYNVSCGQNTNTQLSEQAVRNIISQWYHGTNEHVPVEELEILLADDVKMTYPNTPDTLVGKQAFRNWYFDVLEKFFDETHVVERAEIRIGNNSATANVVVRWETRAWEKGKAKSTYRAFLSKQQFVINKDVSGRVSIAERYIQSYDETAPVYGPLDFKNNRIINNMFTSIVSDYPLKTEEFYSKFFGFKRVRVYLPGERQVVLINNGDSYIQIFPSLEKKPSCLDKPNIGDTTLPGGAQVAIQYAGISKISFFIDDIQSKIEEMGKEAVIIKGLTDGLLPNSKLIWLRDPSGNTLELVQGYFDEINPPQLPPKPWKEKPLWKNE